MASYGLMSYWMSMITLIMQITFINGCEENRNINSETFDIAFQRDK
jgi:hypothetical protein